MIKKFSEPTILPKERAILVGIEIYNQINILDPEESLSELGFLAESAGLDVVFSTSQKLNHPNPSTYIGSGKLEEIKALSSEIKADVIVFDEELSPRHIKVLEELLNLKIIDRTALILDIFAQHAKTREGALQVELAQYEYRLPRLTRAWTHLARQAGGGGGRSGGVGGVGLRGPGETQLEVDRRDIRRRIKHLKSEIEKIRVHRQQYRTRRKKSNLPIITIVGYTNAGKSTLLNQLVGSNVYVANQLFATLDPTTRRIELPGGYHALITDTVGFIQKLPTTLVAAFRATLEEISESDLLIHVADITHPSFKDQIASVENTLIDIEANHIPIILALNKIDLHQKPEIEHSETLKNFPQAIPISALKGQGIIDLMKAISVELYEKYIPIIVKIPSKDGGLISIFHSQGEVEYLDYQPGYTIIQGQLPGRLLARFSEFQIDSDEGPIS